jgi:GT2 family glycosyltransferase
LILDDDAIIDPDYIERLCDLYQEYDSDDLAGICGFDSDLRSPSRLERYYEKIFHLQSSGWRINTVGMHSFDPHIREPTHADWLSGNNASYKKQILEEYDFPHWTGGREALEDVAMGMQLKKAGLYCIIDPELSVTHRESENVEAPFELGVKRAQNRINMFREFGESIYYLLFLWALFGQILRQFLAPLINSQWKFHWLLGAGMIVGILENFLNDSRSVASSI